MAAQPEDTTTDRLYSFYLPAAHRDLLDVLAARQDRSTAAVVRRLVKDGLREAGLLEDEPSDNPTRL
jgi:predicted DNA-binding protein